MRKRLKNYTYLESDNTYVSPDPEHSDSSTSGYLQIPYEKKDGSCETTKNHHDGRCVGHFRYQKNDDAIYVQRPK